MKSFKPYSLSFIYAITIPFALLILCLYMKAPTQIGGDTYTYYSAINSFKKGDIDLWRTPVYPLFLDLTLKVSNKDASTLQPLTLSPVPSQKESEDLAKFVGHSRILVILIQYIVFSSNLIAIF